MHTTLIAAVRGLARLAAARAFAPTSAAVGSAYAAAWLECRALAPHVSAGRLEAVVEAAAQARLARLMAAFVAASAPANDLHHVEAVAL